MNINSPYAKTFIDSLTRHGKSYEDAISHVENASFQQLEMENPTLTRSFVTAVESFGFQFELDSEDIVQLIKEMTGQSDESKVTNMMRDACNLLTENQKALESSLAIYCAASRVHDQWVVDNSHRFFEDKAVKGQHYQYLPLELIGWEETKADLRYVQHVAETIGFQFDENKIRSVWLESASDLLKLCDINKVPYKQHENGDLEPLGYDGVANMINCGCCGYARYWPAEIEAQFSSQPFVQNIIIPQLQENGVGLDEELMKRLEDYDIKLLDNDSQEQAFILE